MTIKLNKNIYKNRRLNIHLKQRLIMNATLIMTINTHQVWWRTRQRSNAKDLAANADVNDNIHT